MQSAEVTNNPLAVRKRIDAECRVDCVEELLIDPTVLYYKRGSSRLDGIYEVINQTSETFAGGVLQKKSVWGQGV
jgi:hypothetical protein